MRYISQSLIKCTNHSNELLAEVCIYLNSYYNYIYIYIYEFYVTVIIKTVVLTNLNEATLKNICNVNVNSI